MTRSVLFAAAALGAAFVSTPALAGGVTYADLDLSTEQGQQQLDRRIDAAARKACGMDSVTTGSILPNAESRRCFQAAKASAKAQIAARIANGPQRGG